MPQAASWYQLEDDGAMTVEGFVLPQPASEDGGANRNAFVVTVVATESADGIEVWNVLRVRVDQSTVVEYSDRTVRLPRDGAAPFDADRVVRARLHAGSDGFVADSLEFTGEFNDFRFGVYPVLPDANAYAMEPPAVAWLDVPAVGASTQTTMSGYALPGVEFETPPAYYVPLLSRDATGPLTVEHVVWAVANDDSVRHELNRELQQLEWSDGPSTYRLVRVGNDMAVVGVARP